jgi:hypothetical protein
MAPKRQAPGFNAGVDTAAPSFAGSYKLFKPEFESMIDVRKPAYDKKNPTATVIRIYPCKAYDEANPGFEPYRIDPGGKCFPGYWYQRLHVAANIGKPGVTFALHNPNDKTRIFDPRSSPLGLLFNAVKSAINKGKGKDSWANALRSTFTPASSELLSWDGMMDGSNGKSANLTRPTEIFMFQGYVPQIGGKPTWDGPGKMPPGWGKDTKSCVFILSSGAGTKFLKLIQQENLNFRGDPSDFENRYVNGDIVSVDSGRFLYVYPYGGDPRVSRTQGLQPGYDPLSRTHANTPGGGFGGHQEDDEERIGYDMHFDKTFQNQPSTLNTPEKIDMVRSKWLYWEDILWFPSELEQVQLMAKGLPASMFEYAFAGERHEWLTEEILTAAHASRSASVPSAPNSPLPHHGQGYSQPPMTNNPLPAAPGTYPAGSLPWDGPSTPPDQALATPAVANAQAPLPSSTGAVPLPAMPTSNPNTLPPVSPAAAPGMSLHEAMMAAGAQAAAEFSGEPPASSDPTAAQVAADGTNPPRRSAADLAVARKGS